MISVMPVRVSLALWAASLFTDFPQENVPILTNEIKWKDWGNQLIQLYSFQRNGAPSSNDYTDWNSWALDVYKAMNG